MTEKNDPDFVGFDPQFKNLVDYIIKITYQIWENREVDTIRRYYGEKMALHTPQGTIIGSEAVVFNTFQTLATFPDRRLLPEDVVWCKEPDKSYYSSHRILSTMTHLGDVLYGKATGKPIIVRTIADCAVKENVIFEEWLVRDQALMLQQMGIESESFAENLAIKEYHTDKVSLHIQLADAVSNSGLPDTAGEYAKKYGESLSQIWGKGTLKYIPELYHEACHVEGPAGHRIYGHEMLNRFYFKYLSVLKDITFCVDHLIELREEEMPVRVAMRWRLSGLHTGDGIFGKPTNKPVYIMGINHAHITRGKVTAEWMMIDEVSIHKQVILNRMQEEKAQTKAIS